MKTVVSNKIYVYGASLELLFWCRDNLVITNPIYATLFRLGKMDEIARKHIKKDMKLYVEVNGGIDLIIPFGCLYAIWNFIKDSPYELKFNDNGQVIDSSLKISMPLFDYQEEAVAKMLQAKGGVLEAAAGSGKTNMGIEIAKRIGKNTLWLCHTTDLLNQTVSRIHSLYPQISVGTITEGDIKMVTNGITVATIQTLVNIDPELYRDKFDVVIGDEIHHCCSSPEIRRMYGKIMEIIPARYKFGLSATLSRSDTMLESMYTIIGCNIKGEFAPVFTIEKSKTNTLIAKHIKVELDTPWTYAVLNEDGTFNYVELINYLSENETRNKKIVENILEASKTHKKQIVLCQRINQCEILNEMLKSVGLNSVVLVGKVTNKKRKEILNSLVDWNVIVATYSLAKEGLDVPELSCLHLAMLTGDKTSTVQSAGRVERKIDGKPEPVVYDYVDINYPYCIGKWKKRVTWLKKR